MTEWKPARNGLLLQTLESALAFFATEGSGRPFRNECHACFDLRGSGIPQAVLPVSSFRSMRMATGLPARSTRILKKNLMVAKANEPNAPDQQTPQF